ncbi:MAG TPA: acyltransferase domain-containing protein, partial [Spirochaetia bacterium]|nr:acyltransferase domain-containing protein [Spirochaetia bacterium]
VFSLEDGLKLIAARARLMAALPRDGEMASIQADEAKAQKAIESFAKDVSIAALNEPEQVVISGKREAVRAVCAALEKEGIKTKSLQVSHAFHSALMEPMMGELEATARTVEYHQPQVALISNVSGDRATSEVSEAGYWVRHVREAVRFGAGVKSLRKLGVDTFIELGPQPVLLGMGAANVSAEGCSWLPSLRKGKEAWATILESLARLYVQGAEVDWKGFDAPYSRRRVSIPTYAFERKRYWIEARPARQVAGEDTGHPLLGVRLPRAEPGALFESMLSVELVSYLGDHRVFEQAVLPGTAYMELAHAAAQAHWGPGNHELKELVLQAPMLLPEKGGCRVQVVVGQSEEEGTTVNVYSQAADAKSSEAWTTHASGKLEQDSGEREPEAIDLEELKKRCAGTVDVGGVYAGFREAGLDYGEVFRGIKGAWQGKGEALAEVALPLAEGGIGAEK